MATSAKVTTSNRLVYYAAVQSVCSRAAPLLIFYFIFIFKQMGYSFLLIS